MGDVSLCELRLASERVRRFCGHRRQSRCLFVYILWDRETLVGWRVLSRFWSTYVTNRAVDIVALDRVFAVLVETTYTKIHRNLSSFLGLFYFRGTCHGPMRVTSAPFHMRRPWPIFDILHKGI